MVPQARSGSRAWQWRCTTALLLLLLPAGTTAHCSRKQHLRLALQGTGAARLLMVLQASTAAHRPRRWGTSSSSGSSMLGRGHPSLPGSVGAGTLLAVTPGPSSSRVSGSSSSRVAWLLPGLLQADPCGLLLQGMSMQQ